MGAYISLYELVHLIDKAIEPSAYNPFTILRQNARLSQYMSKVSRRLILIRGRRRGT